MTFAQPAFLWAFLLVPGALLVLIWSHYRRRNALARLGTPELLDRLSESVNWRGRRWRGGLWFLALAFIIVALARPQWGSKEEVIEREGVQVMVALDVSQSMLAEDLKPNRLKRAKLTISELMPRLQGDEIGLVLFAGASFIQFPLTADYATARMFLEEASPDAISRQGTAIGKAIRTAMHAFPADTNATRENRTGAPPPTIAEPKKVIVIMTDGEDHTADAMAAAQEAAAQGITIYTIGFGSPAGEPIPAYRNGRQVGFKQDSNREVVLSKLDETTLQEIAATTAGNYFRADGTGRDLDALVAALDTLQTAQLEERLETQKVERYQIFLLLALLTLLVCELIPERLQRTAGRRPWFSGARVRRQDQTASA